MNRTFKIALFSAIALGILIVLIVVLLSRSSSTGTQNSSGGFFGLGGNVSTTGTTGGGDSTNSAQNTLGSLQKVFKIASGPIAGAAFVQTFTPTTTLVRYVQSTNGHVLDLAIDVPGAAAKPVSNTTIPGIVSATWGKNGSSTILQYIDLGAIKSVSITFASTTSNGTAAPTRIEFLPSNVVSLAVSPDAKNVAYLLKTATGVDGYVASISGSNPKKLFSFFLSQVALSWPSAGTLLLQTKSASGAPGLALSVNVRTGAVTPALSAPGLSAVANTIFSKVLYQINSGDGSIGKTYAHDMATGIDVPLVDSPSPEKCAWSPASAVTVYCALPLGGASADYLDLWHQGLIQTNDSIVLINTNTGIGTLVTLPGDGGVSAPIDQLMVSSDAKYLMFITRGDRSLWGVRL